MAYSRIAARAEAVMAAYRAWPRKVKRVMATGDKDCRGKGNRCDQCGKASPRVKFEPEHKAAPCDACWFATPPDTDLSRLRSDF